MARHLILLVCSDDTRLDARRHAVRRAGYWSLPAPSLDRALFLVGKIRPTLVLTDAEVTGGRAPSLLRALRAAASLEHVHVVIIGALMPHEQSEVAADPHTHVRHLADDEALPDLLHEYLDAA